MPPNVRGLRTTAWKVSSIGQNRLSYRCSAGLLPLPVFSFAAGSHIFQLSLPVDGSLSRNDSLKRCCPRAGGEKPAEGGLLC